MVKVFTIFFLVIRVVMFFSKGVKSSDGGCVMSLIRSPVHQQPQNSGFSFYKDDASLVEKRLSPPRRCMVEIVIC